MTFINHVPLLDLRNCLITSLKSKEFSNMIGHSYGKVTTYDSSAQSIFCFPFAFWYFRSNLKSIGFCVS